MFSMHRYARTASTAATRARQAARVFARPLRWHRSTAYVNERGVRFIEHSSAGSTRLDADHTTRLAQMHHAVATLDRMVRQTVAGRTAALTVLGSVLGLAVMYRKELRSYLFGETAELASATISDEKVRQTTREAVEAIVRDQSTQEAISALLRRLGKDEGVLEGVRNSLQSAVAQLTADPVVQQQFAQQLVRVLEREDVRHAAANLVLYVIAMPHVKQALENAAKDAVDGVLADIEVRDAARAWLIHVVQSEEVQKKTGDALLQAVKMALIPGFLFSGRGARVDAPLPPSASDTPEVPSAEPSTKQPREENASQANTRSTAASVPNDVETGGVERAQRSETAPSAQNATELEFQRENPGPRAQTPVLKEATNDVNSVLEATPSENDRCAEPLAGDGGAPDLASSALPGPEVVLSSTSEPTDKSEDADPAKVLERSEISRLVTKGGSTGPLLDEESNGLPDRHAASDDSCASDGESARVVLPLHGNQTSFGTEPAAVHIRTSIA